MNLLKNIFSKSYDLNIKDNEIVSPLAGKIINLKNISDPLFAQQIMGKTIAIKTDKAKDLVCAPITGTIKALYPTGHAFGIENNFGLEILVHIGIDTVNAKGEGFKLLGHNQGEEVKVGTPLVKVDFDKLSKTYAMPVFVIITKNIIPTVEFSNLSNIKKNQVISS